MLKLFFFLLLQTSLCLAGTEAGGLPNDSIYQLKSSWVDQSGKKIELAALAGKPVVISMVYLSCTFSCPTTVLHMKELQKLLPASLKHEVRFVLVSFDGEHDTPAVMQEYAAKHQLSYPEWQFITTRNEADVRELASLIDFKYKKIGDGDYEHSFGIVALDTSGRVLGSTIGATMKEQDLVPLLKKH